MKTPDQMEPLEVAKTAQGRKSVSFSLTPARWQRVLDCATLLRTQRPRSADCPKPQPTISALLDGVATGVVGLVRLDDPHGQVVCIVDGRAVVKAPEARPAVKRPRWWDRD